MSLWNRMFGVEERDRGPWPKFRITKVVEEGLYVRYQIEEWTTHYACGGYLWLPAEQGSGYRTLEGAERRVQELLNPPPKVSRTTVSTFY
jgi:hypothetical protein